VSEEGRGCTGKDWWHRHVALGDLERIRLQERYRAACAMCGAYTPHDLNGTILVRDLLLFTVENLP
jgi:hypothetical protein